MLKVNKRRISSISIALVAILLPLLSIASLPFSTASAKPVASVPRKELEQTIAIRAAEWCISSGQWDRNRSSSDIASNVKWGGSGTYIVGHLLDPGNDGKFDCTTEVPKLIQKVIPTGLGNVQLFCQLGGVPSGGNASDCVKHIEGGGSASIPKGAAAQAVAWLKSKADKRLLSDAALQYAEAFLVMQTLCKAEVREQTSDQLANTSQNRLIKVASTDGTTTEQLYYLPDKHKHYVQHHLRDGGVISSTCDNTLSQVDRLAAEYAKSVQEHPNSLGGSGSTPGSDPGGGSSTDSGEEKSCGTELTGVGWMICALLETAVGFADFIQGLFEGLLIVNPLESSGDIYNLWGTFRSIANSVLIIAFLFIIYSQITGLGISNYGIKRMLPRLIVMAIAINASYLIVQISVDIANILGKSLHELIAAASPADMSGGLAGKGWSGLIAIVVSGALTFTIGAIALPMVGPGTVLFFIFLVIVPAILSFMAGVLVLMFRSAIIPVIAILAPVAFAAYLFPNTQGLFDKWKKFFVGMLMLYPMVSIYYGGLKLAAVTISGQEETGWFGLLTGLTLLFLGTGFVLFLAIKSNAIVGKAVSTVRGALNKAAAPATGLGKKTASAMAKEGFNRFKNRDFSKGAKGSRLSKFAGRSVQRFSRSAKDREMRIGLQQADAEQKYREGLIEDPSRLGEMQDSIGGQAVIDKYEQEAAENIFRYKYNGVATDALKSDNPNVKLRALEDLYKRGEYGVGEIEKYLAGGGEITSMKMADKISEMKDKHVGLAKIGVKAMDHFKNNNSPFSVTKTDIDKASAKGFESLSSEAKVRQAPSVVNAAITAGTLSTREAYDLTRDDRLGNSMGGEAKTAFLAHAAGYTPPSGSGSSSSSGQTSAVSQGRATPIQNLGNTTQTSGTTTQSQGSSRPQNQSYSQIPVINSGRQMNNAGRPPSGLAASSQTITPGGGQVPSWTAGFNQQSPGGIWVKGDTGRASGGSGLTKPATPAETELKIDRSIDNNPAPSVEVDSSGRFTPTGSTDDYHDRMTK